eukprot:s384_g10.t1
MSQTAQHVSACCTRDPAATQDGRIFLLALGTLAEHLAATFLLATKSTKGIKNTAIHRVLSFYFSLSSPGCWLWVCGANLQICHQHSHHGSSRPALLEDGVISPSYPTTPVSSGYTVHDPRHKLVMVRRGLKQTDTIGGPICDLQSVLTHATDHQVNLMGTAKEVADVLLKLHAET